MGDGRDFVTSGQNGQGNSKTFETGFINMSGRSLIVQRCGIARVGTCGGNVLKWMLLKQAYLVVSTNAHLPWTGFDAKIA